MGIQINGQTDIISATDGSLTVSGADLGSASASSLNISGIVTASGFSGNVTGNINSTGVSTFSGALTVGTGASISSPATNVLTLGTNNSERVRIDSSGNFNLVNTAGIMTAFKYETPALINNHFKSNSTSSGAYVRMYAAAGTGQWDIYNNGANLRFSDNASAGNIVMDRPLTMSGQNIIMSSGYGIDFSATANSSGTMTSELLDDYEEGTHTTTITLGSGSIVNTFSNTLSYTKIGKVVNIIGRIYVELSSTDVTSFSFTLPFTVTNSNDNDTGNVMQAIRSTGGDPGAGARIFRANLGNSSMSMQNSSGGSYGNFGTTTPHINVFITYHTDS